MNTKYLITITFFCLISIFYVSCSKSLRHLYDGDFVKHSTSPRVPKSFHKTSNHILNFPFEKNKSIKLSYLGCGGYYMVNNNAGILIDPFFSNKSLLGLFFTGTKSKPRNIEFGLEKIKDEVRSKVNSIFVTHSHYDHLMDVPYVSTYYTDAIGTKIYCSNSGQEMIKNAVHDSIKFKNLDKVGITSWYQKGESFTVKNSNNTIRVTPIQTAHAPQQEDKRMVPGECQERENYTSPEKRIGMRKWKQGTTFSYLVDFLDDTGLIEFRVFIQSSAAPPKYGWIHESVLSQHPVNIAILGAASFAYTNDYPSALVNHLSPDKVIICHWEDFFVRYKRENKRTVRKTNINEFVYSLNSVFPYKLGNDNERFIMPNPGVDITINY